MLGQRGVKKIIGKYVGFYTIDEDVASKYAGCTSSKGQKSGYVHMFKVKDTLRLNWLDNSQGEHFIDTAEVGQFLCRARKSPVGLYIDYGDEEIKNEMAICNPEAKLDYIASRKCGASMQSEVCRTPQEKYGIGRNGVKRVPTKIKTGVSGRR